MINSDLFTTSECSKISIDKPQLVQSGDTCSGSDSDFDNASGSKSNAGVAKATFYVVSSCESSDASSEKDLQEVDSFIVVEDIDGVSDKELPPGTCTDMLANMQPRTHVHCMSGDLY